MFSPLSGKNRVKSSDTWDHWPWNSSLLALLITGSTFLSEAQGLEELPNFKASKWQVYVGVSGTPKSSILIGFSIIFTIRFGGFPPIFGNIHVYVSQEHALKNSHKMIEDFNEPFLFCMVGHHMVLTTYWCMVITS